MGKTELPIEKIVQKLNLLPLTGEGGLFTQTYRSSLEIPTDVLSGNYTGTSKPAGTAIFYLLTDQPNSFSAFHRLPSDEIYHFYLGDPLEMVLLYPDGSSQHILLGQDLFNDQCLQFVVPAGVWQASSVAPGGRFSLVGTTMAPGFTPEDFIEGQRETLLAQYPQEKAAVLSLTRTHLSIPSQSKS